MGARPSHFPSRGSCPALLLTSPLGLTWLCCIRPPVWSLGPESLAPVGAGGRGGAGEQLGHSPSGTIHGEPSPSMQPLQPCLKVGCENSGPWTRMKRRRRNRVKARPETGRRKGLCPSSDPGSSAVLVSKRHGEGTEAHTGTLSTVAITIGGPGERPWSSLAVWTGAAHPPAVGRRPSFLPPSPPLCPFLFSLAISLEKLNLVFLPEKKCLREWATGASNWSNLVPRLPLRWLERPSHCPGCCPGRARQTGNLACLLCSCYTPPPRSGFLLNAIGLCGGGSL